MSYAGNRQSDIMGSHKDRGPSRNRRRAFGRGSTYAFSPAVGRTSNGFRKSLIHSLYDPITVDGPIWDKDSASIRRVRATLRTTNGHDPITVDGLICPKDPSAARKRPWTHPGSRRYFPEQSSNRRRDRFGYLWELPKSGPTNGQGTDGIRYNSLDGHQGDM